LRDRNLYGNPRARRRKRRARRLSIVIIVFICIVAFIFGTLYYLAGKYEKVNPGKKYEDVIKVLHPIRSEDGKYYRQISVPFWSETYFNADIDNTKQERGLAMLDYFLSEDGYNLIHYGIEGKDFTKDSTGKVTLTPQKDASGNNIHKLICLMY
jgi:putative aldouronate transport system substrate-binding protein